MKFEKPVTIHVGQQAYPTQKFPGGDTNEDNVFTRYLKDNFNIDVVVDWSAATGNDYNQKVNLCIASNTLPDGLQVDRKAFLSAAKADMLYDFTGIFPQYVSPQVKAIMDSGDGIAYEYAKYNDKQLSMVGVDVAPSGQSMLNIRQDWLDQYNLKAPTTLDEIEAVAKVFKEKKPAGDATVPIAGPDKNGSGYSSFLSPGVAFAGFEPVFAAYDAYPGYWIKDENGKAVYGTTTENSKKALERLANWYKQGLIDPEMGVRDNATEFVNSGNVGMYFCAWWAIGYGTTDAYKKDPNANWQTYPVNADDGKWYTRMQCPVASYTIFNKNISEDVAKAAIIMNNVWVRDENKLGSQNTSIYWYPLRNSMGALDEIETTYKDLIKVLNGEAKAEDFNDPNSPYKLLYNDAKNVSTVVKNYSEDKQLGIANFDISSPDFSRLYSVLIGARPTALATPDKLIYSEVYSQTPTMEAKWANLETAEKEMTLKIITGKDSTSTFDEYVKKWSTEGGNEILAEVQKEIDAKK
jgi:multiple sugar transport system substrate-binding protein/putative aldouronate transport system substrate-binding protein